MLVFSYKSTLYSLSLSLCISYFLLLQEQKKHQGQLLTEQEVLYGSKPSPIKNSNVKKAPRLSYGGASNRKVSLCTPLPQARATPAAKATPAIRTAVKNECITHKATQNIRTASSSGEFL